MSSAFVKEGDDMWLRDIAPTIKALTNFLTNENGGLPVIEKENIFDKEKKFHLHKMSDGFTYAVRNNKWEIIE